MTALRLDILDIFMKATAILAAAALAEFALTRRGPAAARHLVWALAMIALLALPAAIATVPQWQVRIPVERASIAAVAGTVGAVTTSEPAGAPRSVATNAVSTTPPSGRPSITALATGALSVLYMAGALLLLARLAVEPLALRRLTRSAGHVTDAGWLALLDACVGEMRIATPVRLLRSGREIMPMTFGTLHPAIVLPASSIEWDDDRRRAVLLHELAHIARRDCLIQRLTAIACALYWPHPGVWFGARRLRNQRELACDDRVIAAGAGARDYAGHLLELARSLGAAPAPSTALGMARPRQLEQRLLAVLDAARNRAALGSRSVATAVAIAVIVVGVVAAVRAAIVPAPLAEAEALSERSSRLAPLASLLQQDLSGTWELRLTQDPKVVQITVRTVHGSHGRTIAIAQLAGLPVDQISAARAEVRFPIRRDAGTFSVDGICRSGICGGTYTFEPDPAFADALVKRGIGRPTPQQQFSLAIADVGTAYLDALAAAGYTKPDIPLLVRAAQHGVDAGYLRDMSGLGYRLGTLDRLIQLRDHGVDPQYIRGMAANGISGLSADELVRTRDHGVDPEYIRGLAAFGYGGLSVDALVKMRDHGVDPEYIRGMADNGIAKLPIEELVRTRDHGVDPEYVRGMAELGYKGVALDDLIRMRDHGVNPEYVRRLQRTGVRNLSVDEIIRRRDRGE